MSSWTDDILDLHDKLRRAWHCFITKPDTADALVKITGCLLEVVDRLVDLEVSVSGIEKAYLVNKLDSIKFMDPADVSDHLKE